MAQQSEDYSDSKMEKQINEIFEKNRIKKIPFDCFIEVIIETISTELPTNSFKIFSEKSNKTMILNKIAFLKNGDARNLAHLVPDIIRWMPPEQIKEYKEQRYYEKTHTFNSEIFRIEDPNVKKDLLKLLKESLAITMQKIGKVTTCAVGMVLKKNEKRAMELFKEAADNGHSDAQVRYVTLLINNLKSEQNIARKNELRREILNYFKLAANNKNNDAIYYLADIYLHGKLNVKKNKELGLKYLKLAA
ncbi:hypothetical protein C2G38_2157055 [Gigaspora rosea]|uniref:Sel1 repeat-containing protein n=1 Tax=Gigaspora rosea TaxID=44941 RepID=A0A397WAS2_9GLOM|nr:hypothetical protein C2G38_2157055 [Gigaspora rosea]